MLNDGKVSHGVREELDIGNKLVLQLETGRAGLRTAHIGHSIS